MSLREVFCDVDDFMLSFEPHWKASQVQAGKQRARAGQLCPSEVMTILIHFHQSHSRTCQAYYTEPVQIHVAKEFPHLVRYPRFVALIPGILVPMLAYLQSRFGACTGISFIDSTALKVGHAKRISGHRVCAADARRAVSSMGWCFGCKLHLATSGRGERLSCCLTPGTVDDRTPVPQMVKRLRGKLFGDRGYISVPLTHLLFEQGLHLITRLRNNRKNQLMHLSDTLRLAQTSDYRVQYRPTQAYARRLSMLAIGAPSILWCMCWPGSLPTAIRTKKRVCISMNTLS